MPQQKQELTTDEYSRLTRLQLKPRSNNKGTDNLLQNNNNQIKQLQTGSG
jgi:hypothetical protein